MLPGLFGPDREQLTLVTRRQVDLPGIAGGIGDIVDFLGGSSGAQEVTPEEFINGLFAPMVAPEMTGPAYSYVAAGGASDSIADRAA